MSRTEDEMQITLARLRDEFGMDVAQAQNLHGQELADWLELAEDELFNREIAGLRPARPPVGAA